MANTVLETLRGALKILSAKKRWGKGAFAASKGGHPVPSSSIASREDLVCFCAAGALMKANNGRDGSYYAALHELADALPRYWQNQLSYDARVFSWNDSARRTHAQVVTAFKKAIAVQRSKVAAP